MKWATTEMDWTRILAQADVPEPPGYRETLEAIEAHPYTPPLKKKPKSKRKR